VVRSVDAVAVFVEAGDARGLPIFILMLVVLMWQRFSQFSDLKGLA
jgi:hypothetical protein